MDDLRVERVLRCAECIPAGRIAPYSMVGRISGESARFVGRVMSLYGSNAAWWRVTNVAGTLPEALLEQAQPHWAAEGIPHSPAGARITACLADEDALARSWARAVVDLG